MLNLLTYQYMRHAVLAGILIAVLCPLIGNFLVLKRFSSVGDALSHSAFAGVAAGLVFGFEPTLSAFIYTVISALIIEYLRNKYTTYQEIVISIVLTLNIGIAIILASTGKTSTSINQYLFGSILTVSQKDIFMILTVLLVSLIFIFANYSKLVYSTFDEEGAKIHGINYVALNYVLAALAGACVGVSIRVTGILVVSSILVIPVAAAMNLKKGFKKTMMFSIIFGLMSVLLGLYFSSVMNSAPGGTIAVTSVIILLLTLIIPKKS